MRNIKMKGSDIFKALPIGTMFITENDERKNPLIWVKTPFADMYEHNNPVNENGGFCNAICINADNKNLYIQCHPKTMCQIIDTENLFTSKD